MILDYNLTLLLLIFMRMSGCILFNPVLGNKDIPAIIKISLSLVLSFFVYMVLPNKDVTVENDFVFIFILLKELGVGLIVGYIMQLFTSVIIIAGEAADMQIGLSMSKIYDPQTNVSMPVTSTILNALYMLIFFSSNSHITMIKIFVKLGQISPYGDIAFSKDLFSSLVSLLSLIMIYAVKLALPILAVGFISEIGVGLLMKAVPQINVFIVNIQLKILLGFFTILLLVPSYSSFLGRLIQLMFDKIIYVFGM